MLLSWPHLQSSMSASKTSLYTWPTQRAANLLPCETRYDLQRVFFFQYHLISYVGSAAANPGPVSELDFVPNPILCPESKLLRVPICANGLQSPNRS